MNWKVLEHQHPQWGQFYIFMMKECWRRKPLLQNQHLQSWLRFAAAHKDAPDALWRKDWWTDETKTEVFGHSDDRFVWRWKVRPLNLRTQYELSNVTVAASCSGAVMLPVILVQKVGGKIKDYLWILHLNFKSTARQLKPGQGLVQNWPAGCSDRTKVPRTLQR